AEQTAGDSRRLLLTSDLFDFADRSEAEPRRCRQSNSQPAQQPRLVRGPGITTLNAPAEKSKPRRPRFQFSLLGLMVLMFAAAAAAAPGYYMMNQRADLPQAKLVGMLMVLAGPLL